MNFVHKTSFVYNKNRKAGWLCGFLFFGFLSFLICGNTSQAEDNGTSVLASTPAAAPNQELINQKKEEISKIQADIAKYQADSKAKRTEGNTLENEIAIFDNNILQNQLEIRETKLNIESAEMEMEGAQNQIEEDRVRIDENKAALKSFLQNLYSHQDDSLLEVLITRESISDFFNEISAVKAVQDKVLATVIELKQKKESLDNRNQALEEDQQTYENLISMRYEQNTSLENLKAQKNEMLEITSGEEDKYQALVAHNRSLLPSLRSELRDLQSLGSNIQFDDAISEIGRAHV
jgi:peptidoglycan hydrolase CwlO-like protein